MNETVMNLRGLKCPLPALRVRKKLSGLNSGDIVVAECTDPLAAIDIPEGAALDFAHAGAKYAHLFWLMTWIGIGCAVIALLFAPVLRRMMHGVR